MLIQSVETILINIPLAESTDENVLYIVFIYTKSPFVALITWSYLLRL
jgi:hypothetical protein